MSRRRPPTDDAPATEDGSDPRRFHDRRGLHRPPAPPTGRPPGRKALQLAR